MRSKAVSVSLTEAQIWKLGVLEKQTGISKSRLIQRGLMYLFTDRPTSWENPNGLDINEITSRLEADYQEGNNEQRANT